MTTHNTPDSKQEALSEKEITRLGSQIVGDVLAQVGVRGTSEEREGADTIAAAWVSKIVERVTEELNYQRSRASVAAASSPAPAEMPSEPHKWIRYHSNSNACGAMVRQGTEEEGYCLQLPNHKVHAAPAEPLQPAGEQESKGT